MISNVCPVCAYDGLYEPPRSSSGGGSYEICPCCGFQFGVSDDDEGFDYDGWRQAWIDNGMNWFSRSRSHPDNWDPREQLRRIGRGIR